MTGMAQLHWAEQGSVWRHGQEPARRNSVSRAASQSAQVPRMHHGLSSIMQTLTATP